MRVQAQWLLDRFRYPTPRVSLGLALRGLASACIDVSDGLLGDCGRLAHASGCGVSLDYEALPLSEPLRAAVGEERARELALTGGEDYELCFTVPQAKLEEFASPLPGCRVRLEPDRHADRGAGRARAAAARL